MDSLTQTEILFNSVEDELARRHAVGETPDVYLKKPADRLSATVKAWWHLYHETRSIKQLKNRSVWARNHTLPADSLDTPALVNSLNQIATLIDLIAIGQFRTPAYHEESAVIMLHLIANYYAELQN